MHLDLDIIQLKSGAHSPESGECCFLELYSCVMKKKWGDHPDDVSPIIGDFLRKWNDNLNDDDRQQLKALIPVIAGTKTTNADEITRSWMMLDWLVRVNTAMWMEVATLTEHAAALRALPEITDLTSANAAKLTIDAARDAANANANANAIAYAIAYATAYATATATAYANAYAIATATATAYAYAYANANATATAKLRPTAAALQASALDLVRRLSAVGRAS